MKEIRSEEWFKIVFDRYFDPLRNYLYYMSGDVEWSDDALQQIFLMVWEKRDSLRDETLRPFLYVSAKNLYLKMKRKEAVVLKFERLQPAVEESESPEEELESREFEENLQKAISELPERCRTVFLMSRIDEMKNQQIAQSLGISVKAVEKQITKAMMLLKNKLGLNSNNREAGGREVQAYLLLFL